MEIIATSSTKSVPLTTESPIFTTEFRSMESTGNRRLSKTMKSIPSSMEHDAALKALTRSSSASIESLVNNRTAPKEAAIPEKLLENIRTVGRTRKGEEDDDEEEEEGTDPPGTRRSSKPVEPVKNFVRSQYARPSIGGGPRSFNRSRISSVSSDGRNLNGSHTPKPPASVRTLTKEYTKSLAEAMSNLTDKSEREPTQRWNLPKTSPTDLDSSDDGVDMLTSHISSEYSSSIPASKTPSMRGGSMLNKELGRLEKALTDVENAPNLNGNMAVGWSKLKSNLAIATRINASDRVRDMAVAAASAAILRKSMAAEPTKVPDMVKEMAHAAATAAAIRKKAANEKEMEMAGPKSMVREIGNAAAAAAAIKKKAANEKEMELAGPKSMVREIGNAAAAAAAKKKKAANEKEMELAGPKSMVREIGNAAAAAATKKTKAANEKKIDTAPKTLKAVRPPSSRTLPPDEKPVSSMYPPPNEVSITTSVRSVLPGIKRGTGSDFYGSEESMKYGNSQSGSSSSIEEDEYGRRFSKIERNITAIMSTPVDGDTILGVPSQISDPCYAAVRTPYQRLSEQTTAAAQVRVDAIRERKEALELLREGGGKDNNSSGSVRISSKADEVVKRLTNPAAFTGMSKVRFDESAVQTKPTPTVPKKPPNKIDFFSTYTGEEGPQIRKQVSASMNTLNVLPKQIPGRTKNLVSGSDETSTPRFVGTVRLDNLQRQKATAASSSVDTLQTRRASSNETSQVLNQSDGSLKSGRKNGGKSSSNSLRGSSGSLGDAEQTDGTFGMHNRYWPTDEAKSNATLEDEEATKVEKRRRRKEAKVSASRLLDKSNYTGVHRFGSTNRLAAPGRSPWNVL